MNLLIFPKGVRSVRLQCRWLEATFHRTGRYLQCQLPNSTHTSRYRAILFGISIMPFIICYPSLSSPNDNTQMKSMRLAACPNSPNCVSSLAQDQAHLIKPFSYEGSGLDALNRLKQTILSLPRTRLVTDSEGYIHVEFRSKFLGFVDDVEAQLDETKNVIEIRSASRTGYWDLGANRKRIELIRTRFYGSDE